MKKFEFNENGVCINPDVLGGNDYQNSIRTYCKNGKWFADVCYTFTGQDWQGGMHGVQGEYDTKRDAVLAACKHLQDKIKYAKSHWKVDTTDSQACVDKAYQEVNQLSLF